MFNGLPLKLLVKMCHDLEEKCEDNLSFVSSYSSSIYRQKMECRLAAILATPTSKHFIQLLAYIQNDAEDGRAILLDETCKRILLEKRPKELPHWMLSLAECHLALVSVLLKDEDYKNSLSLSEFRYLISNYPDLEALIKKDKINEPTEVPPLSINETEEIELDHVDCKTIAMCP
ncbi:MULTISPECIES: hypothetical protein [Legionella]|uniref:hypothetical protein n=1 Tax=Legionella TaxID=445 RepID=UPI00096923F6|nr:MULTISPECIES: hypothetical protein [Legionella]MBN9228101.1 hypothetical protein [Legionella steelei]OJW11313.1 MAG: hypothetical protein BGO44_01925 [Legionella sp. 39-23]